MTTVIIGMFVALVLALAVVALVAVPARREGRDLLTPQGEQLMQTARDKTVEVAGAARERVRPSGQDQPPAPGAERPADQPESLPTAAEPQPDIDLREERARTHD